MRECWRKSNVVVSYAPAAAMKSVSSPEVTQLLQDWTSGDKAALEKLAPMVFAELKRLARRHMAHERPDHTLESGALVNEAYLRMVHWPNARWQNRAHFFGMCARMMRQILVDHARARNYQKRCGDAQRISLDEVAVVSESKGPQLLELDEALKHFADLYPRQSQVIEMRFFGGL